MENNRQETDPDEGQKDLTGAEFLRKAIKELGGPNQWPEYTKPPPASGMNTMP